MSAPGNSTPDVATAAAEVLRREGVEKLLAYPLNPLIESAAAAGSGRSSSGRNASASTWRTRSPPARGDNVGVFCMQAGPGVENSFGAVAQAYSEGVPLDRDPRRSARGADVGAARVQRRAELPAHHQVGRAGHHAGAGSSRPCAGRSPRPATDARARCSSEIPATCGTRRSPGLDAYEPTRRAALRAGHRIHRRRLRRRWSRRSAPASTPARACTTARAWAELQAAGRAAGGSGHDQPGGQERVPGGPSARRWARAASRCRRGVPARAGRRRRVRHRRELHGHRRSASASRPPDKTFIHNTVDPGDINKNIPAEHALIGDAKHSPWTC